MSPKERRAFAFGYRFALRKARRGYLRGLDRARTELETELARATEGWDGRLCELEEDYELLVRKMQDERAIREALLERDPNTLLN